ncbi:MAG: hypothetical protein HQK99_17690, partial [Nitrospirae bacterium]|nr:hypothetical protein [Nitrospirota bacterium]
WPGITGEVRKTGLKFVNIVQSVYDTSLKAISGHCEKSKTEAQNLSTHKCRCTETKEAKLPEVSKEVDAPAPTSEMPQAETLEVPEPLQKANDAPKPNDNGADTVKPPARKPRAKKDAGADSTLAKSKSTEPKPAIPSEAQNIC